MTAGLTVTRELTTPIALLCVTGHLDAVSAVDMRAALHKAMTDQPSAIVVDVAGLTADDIALTVFSAFSRSAGGWTGCPVLLYGMTRSLRADLNRMAIARTVPLYADRSDALAAAASLPAPRRFGTWLPASPDAPSSGRELVARACTAWRQEPLIDDAELVITELVSNAVRHAGGELEITAALRDRFLHLSVRDGSPDSPRLTLPDPDTGAGGRGLILVDSVAAAWGAIRTPAGKVVWATLRRHS